METVLTGIESAVFFRNSQGLGGRGTLVHITRTTIVFEVYNPYSIVQLSEVLTGMQVMRGERTIYNGRATVSNILRTGLMVIVSATLLDTWSDLAGLASGELLQIESERFVRDWEASHDLRPNYRLVVSRLRNFLGELSRWLDEAEAGACQMDENQSDSLKTEFYEEVKTPLVPKIASLFEEFEEEAGQIPPEEITAHKAFARRELHPLTLCSPFVHRTYTKPLGFAGDYEMVNMMLRESRPRHPNTYANIVDEFHINSAAPEAHRNRIDMLVERISQECKRVIKEGRPFRVLSIGCGPAVEVQRFIRQQSISKFAVIHLMDFCGEALGHAKRCIDGAINECGARPKIQFKRESIDELLREAHVQKSLDHIRWDMVYCAGLFDYLTDQTCRNLLMLFKSWVNPGGLLTITNVHPANPNRHQMEHLLEWYLNYRDEPEMTKLASEWSRYKKVQSDPTGYNVFLDIRQ